MTQKQNLEDNSKKRLDEVQEQIENLIKEKKVLNDKIEKA